MAGSFQMAHGPVTADKEVSASAQRVPACRRWDRGLVSGARRPASTIARLPGGAGIGSENMPRVKWFRCC